MTELKVIGILVILTGAAVALIGGLLASLGQNATESIIAGLVAFTGGLLAGIGGNIIAIAVKK